MSVLAYIILYNIIIYYKEYRGCYLCGFKREWYDNNNIYIASII